jgi:hypothetical protein
VIDHGMHECDPLEIKRFTMTAHLHTLPVVDYAMSVNVIEHLTPDDAMVMIENLRRLVRGPTVLWYSPIKNGPVLAPWMTDQMHADNDALLAAKGKIQVHVFRFSDSDLS